MPFWGVLLLFKFFSVSFLEMFRFLSNITQCFNESTMLKRTLYGTALMLALLATGCGDANQKTSGLPQIDVRTDYPEKEICLQDVAEVSYIPLETTDEILLDEGTGVEVLSSKGIVCVSDNKVYIFHPDGKLGPFLIRKVKARENIVIFFIRMWIGNVRKFMYMMVLRKRYLSIRWMEYTSIKKFHLMELFFLPLELLFPQSGTFSSIS